MPKIVINEYDLTKAGTGEYANFSVVVPGLLGPNADLADLQSKFIFDENGIYECSSQSDFVKYVGKTTGTVSVACLNDDATAPTITTKVMLAEKFVEKTEQLKEAEQAEPYDAFKDEVTGVMTVCFKSKEAFINCLANAYAGYMPVVNPELEDDEPVLDENGKPVHSFDQPTDGEASSGYSIYTTKQNGTSTVGRLMDASYVYTSTDYDKVLKLTPKASGTNEVSLQGGILTLPDNTGFDAYTIELCVSPATAFYIIADGANQGNDATTGAQDVNHYGNQIAYELLGLGYTVLYKAIDTTENAVKLSDAAFWNALKDKSTYDFRYVVTGITNKNSGANAAIISLCEWKNTTLDDADVLGDGRGDCFALVDIDATVYTSKTQSEAIPCIAKEANKFASAYAACFAPTVTYTMVEDAEYNNNTTFPASFHYLACAANSANNNYNEWYANAGYTRGVAKYTIQSLGCKLGDMAVQALQPRFLATAGVVDSASVTTNVSVNLVIKIKNSYYLWGNRTAKKLGTRGASDGDLVAQHFLNIRQLCTTIKKQVYVTCRRLTYDPNSNNLWINFRALLTPMLEKMKADQGIRDYEFVKDATDRKALLKASIRIVPIEAVEDFEIGLYLEDSLTEASVTEA